MVTETLMHSMVTAYTKLPTGEGWWWYWYTPDGPPTMKKVIWSETGGGLRVVRESSQEIPISDYNGVWAEADPPHMRRALFKKVRRKDARNQTRTRKSRLDCL